MTSLTLSDLLRNTTTNENGCQLWCGAKTSGGYGEVVIDCRPEYVHVIAWQLFHGFLLNYDTPADGSRRFEAHHLCARRDCCNPYHIIRLSQRAHAQLHAQIRHQSQETCCHGHSWQHNEILVGNSRICRQCRRERQRGILGPKVQPILRPVPVFFTLPYPISATQAAA